MELALAKALLPLAGFSEADRVHHEGWKQLIHPEDHPVIASHIQHVLSGQHDVCVFRVITRTGTTRWFGVLTSPVWDEAGRRVAHVYGQVRDHCADGEAAVPLSPSRSV